MNPGRAVLTVVLATMALSSCGTNEPGGTLGTQASGPTENEPSTETDDLQTVLESRLERWYGSGEIGGAVAGIGLADGQIIVAATGDAAPGELAAVDDTMRAGSITKTFMSALTLRLHNTGVLDVDDPVAQHLPDLGLPDTITIRSLLAHTSGIVDSDPAPLVASMRADPGQRFEFTDLIGLAEMPSQTTAEAQQFAYANANYHLTGGVIEAATNQAVPDVLRAEVLAPAGLADTYLAGAEAVPNSIVPGNVDLDGDGREDSLAGVPYLAVESHAWTAGALVTTPHDLIQFARALFSGSIVSEQALDWMTNTSAAEDGHGLGIFDIGVDNATVYGNSGGGPGFHANFAHNPTLGTTAVIFTNCPSCPAGGNDTWQLLVDLLTIAGESH